MLVDGVKPTDAVKTGQDKAICGNCTLRKSNTQEKLNCYVNDGFGPNAIFKAIERNSIKTDTSKIKIAKIQRHGSKGDAACLSKEENMTILKLAKKTLNYTHAWSDKKQNYLKQFSMASVHSKEEAIEAQKLGFKTFRILDTACEKLLPNEIVCYNFTKGIQCVKCQICCGHQTKGQKSVAIPKHNI
jgi:hypothetical protein